MVYELNLKYGNIEDLEKIFPFYQDDFIEEERKTLNHLKHLMTNSNYHLLLGFNNNTLVGYSFICEIKDNKKLWLDYIAILKEYRSMNYGSLFLKKIIQYYEREFDGMFFEIEKPDVKSPDYPFQLKRLKFYSQFELEKLPLKYKIPTPSNGFPIDLYYKSFSKKETADQLSYKDIKYTVNFIFNTVHFDISSKEKIFAEIFEGLHLD